MELIRDVIEWVGNDLGSTIFTLGPYMLVGLLGLYLLWLLVGYLRVSQVGIGEPRPAAHAIPLEASAAQATGAETPGAEVLGGPRGVPYCAFDGLRYPVGARFCTQCERDLQLECMTCGATVAASEPSCYRCGTPTGAQAAPLLG